MLQAEDTRQQATTELAAREQALADAQMKVERLQRGKANGNRPEQVTADLAAPEQDASTREQFQPVHEDGAERHPLLMVACAVAALAGIGLITGTMLAPTVDTAHVTTAGVIGAISGGAMLAVVWVAFVANWYRKHSMPVQDEAPAAAKSTSNGSRPKSSSNLRSTS